jgi:hypothetical protein
MYTGFLWGCFKEIDQFEDIGTYGKIILKCILKNRNEYPDYFYCMWFKMGKSVGSFVNRSLRI